MSIQTKKYDKLLSANSFDTVGALQMLTARDLLELGVAQGLLLLVSVSFLEIWRLSIWHSLQMAPRRRATKT